jgi:aminoglycoside 2''-phosphotransferase
MSTHLLYLSQIRTAIPNTPFEKIEQSGGQFNDVVVINKEWVFRFPRYREGVTQLASEIRLLEALKGRLPLPIPQPLHQRLDPPVPGLAFVGYQCLPGDPMYREALDQVRDIWAREDLAAQLASFLRALHGVPLTEIDPVLRASDLHAADGRGVWENMYAEVRDKLFPTMRPDARRGVSTHFESYLDDPALQEFIPCLRHGDFGGSNILWDRERSVITGIIDFSACAPGDPAYDLASVSTLGNDFFDRLLPRYEHDAAKRAALLTRARFYRGTFALTEALDGLKNDDPVAYKSGMEGYT